MEFNNKYRKGDSVRKIINWINKNKRLIYTIFLIFLLIHVIFGSNGFVFAETNREFYNPDDTFTQTIESVISSLVSASSGLLGKPFATLVNIVNIILFILLYGIFVGSGVANGLSFPFPDQIIFNGLSMLDPNFINPNNDTTAIINIIKGIIQNIYYSFFSVAGIGFVLASAVIGIKIAFSTLASQKALYKEAIKHWISGIAMLFLMHIVLAGMFAINEKICESASKYCKDVKITVGNWVDVIPAGSQVKGLIQSVSGWFSEEASNTVEHFGDMDIPGHGGVVLKFVLKGVAEFDLIYAIGLAIMLGQTFSLVLTYFKRLFYCIILGMVAPIVVVIDTIQKVFTGRDTGILKTWFQNMVALIFNQSFQAIFLSISIIIIGKVSGTQNDGKSDLIEALIVVISLNSVLKFDKLFKEMFGFKDSKILGGINDNAMKGFAAIKSGIALAQRSAEPFKKRAEAKSRIAEATKKRNKILEQIGQNNTNNITSNVQTNQTTQTSNSSSDNQNNQNSNGQQNNNQSQGAVSNEQLLTALNNLSSALNSNTQVQKEDKNKKLNDELAQVEAEIRKARADQRAESLKAFTRFGTSVGALGFGLGATDNLGDAVTVGNLVDMPMDIITDRSVNRGVYGNTSRRVGSAQYREQLENKYRDSGMSAEQARAQADKAVKSMQETLNKKIPETLVHMTKDITTDALGGVADVLNREGRKFSKQVRKDMYKSTRIDDI